MEIEFQNNKLRKLAENERKCYKELGERRATSKFVPKVVFHPGVTLAEKLKEMNMSIKEFALRVSKPEKTIHAVIKGDSSVTSDMSVAFESVTNIPAHFWLNKQRNYDEYKARLRRETVMKEACAWSKNFSYSQMAELGWVASYKETHEKAKALMSFFQISSVKAWEDYYLNQKLKVAFRISLSNTKDPYALSAWLRQGEIQASLQSVEEYDESKLKKVLPVLKTLMCEQPVSFASKAKEILAESGVKLLYTPCLSGAYVSGSTRWIKGYPCIQISGYNKRYDIFWFTLFHEIGHILLHGKKDIFLERDCYSEEEQKKETEANRFSSNILLQPEEEREIIENGNFSLDVIKDYAMKFNTHPSVIAGRLLHNKIISSARAKEMIVPIDLFKD